LHDTTWNIEAWPTLPEPIRAGILAMIRSASKKGHKPEARTSEAAGRLGIIAPWLALRSRLGA
jgi:hypothetical protein